MAFFGFCRAGLKGSPPSRFFCFSASRIRFHVSFSSSRGFLAWNHKGWPSRLFQRKHFSFFQPRVHFCPPSRVLFPGNHVIQRGKILSAYGQFLLCIGFPDFRFRGKRGGRPKFQGCKQRAWPVPILPEHRFPV